MRQDLIANAFEGMAAYQVSSRVMRATFLRIFHHGLQWAEWPGHAPCALQASASAHCRS